MVERRVLLGDAVLRHALGLGEVKPQDLVRGARVDVVRADQVEALLAAAFRAHQVIHRGGRLLVDRRTGVDDVLGALLALVLNGVEKESVVLLEHRQHGLAAHRGPAAENRRHFVLRQEFLGLFSKEVPVRGGILHDRLDRAPQHAASFIDFLNGHEDDFLEGSLADGHGAAQRMQHTYLDGLLCHGAGSHQPCQQEERQPEGAGGTCRGLPFVRAGAARGVQVGHDVLLK